MKKALVKPNFLFYKNYFLKEKLKLKILDIKKVL